MSQDAMLRASMGIEGRKQALGRSWEQIFDGLIRDYEMVIDSRRIKSRAEIFTA
ncbi:hypothetical protein D3C84_1220230 [compost metagenome]